MLTRNKDKNYGVEDCLRRALSPLGEGWDIDVIEAIIDNNHVDFADGSDSSISAIESALRELLGSAADMFIERFYAELKRVGYCFT